MFKKIITLVTAIAVALSLSSCGKSGEEQAPAVAAETTAEGKKIIKLTIMGLNEDMSAVINDFNKTNEKYEIEVTDLFSLDYRDSVTRLNLEITSGSNPDIIECVGLPMESYIEKGVFANLYDFIDSDPDMSREDFLQNIFKAYEVDGGLYENITSFYLQTIMGKSSIAGEMQGRTADDFIGLAEKYPDKKFVDMQWSKDRIFGFFMGNGWESFVDGETGKCDFNNEKFIRILEFCNTFPDKADDVYMTAPNWRQNEADDLRSGKTLFAAWALTIDDFYSLRKQEYYTFGEPAAIVGYPYADGNGAMICSASADFAIFENSPVKEGAWEFLRYFYSDEYQREVVRGYRLPVKKSAIEFAAEDAEKGFYLSYADEYTDEYGINTDEDNQRIIGLINGAACRADNSENFVYNIIQEEAAMYFAGQRPVGETAEIIQNRVQNYLDENR